MAKSTLGFGVSGFPVIRDTIGSALSGHAGSLSDAYIAAHSTDKRAPSQNALPSKPHAALKRPQVTSSKSNTAGAPDPHAKSKEEFQRVLDLVRGKKRS